MLEKRMDDMLNKLIQSNRIPGCGLKVRKNGELVYDKCLGLYDVEKEKAVTERTIYRMASMTKLIIAVSIMHLTEEGVLSLNDNLVKFFPHYPEEKKRVRIRHLLNHSSSLGQLQPRNDFYDQNFAPEDLLEERVDKWADMPFDCELGESADYGAIVNFDILGRIIEIVTGENLDAWLKKNIFHPLGMMDTGYFLTEEQKIRKAPIYISTDGKRVLPFDNDPLIQAVTSDFGYCSGAGGIFSTLYDYDRFTTMLVNGGKLDDVRIISEKSLDLMRTPNQITDKECRPGCPWGLGFMVFIHPEKANMDVAPGTFGWSGAFGTHMFVQKEMGISATFVVSMGDLQGAESFISRNIEKIVFEELM